MRSLAEFVMRGRRHAAMVTVLAAALPLLNWLSNAVVSLVILRRGPAEGMLVALWAMLPLGFGLYYFGDPSPIIALIGTAVLAWVLRVTTSWEVTLGIAVLVSGIGSLIFELTATEVIAVIVEWYLEYTRQVAAQLNQVHIVTPEATHDTIMGFFAMGQAWAMLAFLILGRWWQSQLYNPGGFQKEFHQLRLNPMLSGGLVVLVGVCFAFPESLGRWIPLLTVPLIIAAIGMVHWLVKDRKLSGHWLFAFYMALILLFQVFYPLLASLALIDSWLNLRTRVQTKEV